MKNNLTIPLISLAVGVIIGAAIMWLSFNCCRETCCSITPDPTLIQKIDPTTANTYFKAYYDSASPVTLKGFTISLQQFNAMQNIAKGDSKVGGFRIYLGKKGRIPVRIVVGTGSPDHQESIYVTDEGESGPCPYMCDDTSPIIKE